MWIVFLTFQSLRPFINFILTVILWGRWSRYDMVLSLFLTEERVLPQRYQKNCLWSHSQVRQSWNWSPGALTPNLGFFSLNLWCHMLITLELWQMYSFFPLILLCIYTPSNRIHTSLPHKLSRYIQEEWKCWWKWVSIVILWWLFWEFQFKIGHIFA